MLKTNLNHPLRLFAKKCNVVQLRPANYWQNAFLKFLLNYHFFSRDPTSPELVRIGSIIQES